MYDSLKDKQVDDDLIAWRKAFVEGMKAYEDGEDLCPYKDGSSLEERWYAGYGTAAKSDQEQYPFDL